MEEINLLESVIIIMMAMGFVLFILGIMEESIVFAATSMLMWIVVLAGYLYIEVPTETDTYSEYALFAVAFAFIIINVIWIIIRYIENQFQRNVRP